MKKILITGFEPFGGETINPSWEAVKRLPDKIGDAVVEKMSLPVVFGESADKLIAEMRAEKPGAIICVGQAGGRAGINIERIAINIDDTKSPDNKGNQPTDTPICVDGPAAYFATLPVKQIVAALKEAQIPAVVSDTAGTYVCNHVMYTVLHHATKHSPQTKVGFIHIPYLPEQALDKNNAPSMSLDYIVRALEIIVDTV
ncbi:MAG: pyroglutamyl-peptidase I [Defluviitaleaceae bacterium]|nr:pyroglutamyl-peptidase I [Defluviitaleaceae bacterium]